MVSQDHDLFAASLLENILYGDKNFLEVPETSDDPGHVNSYFLQKNSVNSKVPELQEDDAREFGEIYGSDSPAKKNSWASSSSSVDALVAAKFEQVNAMLTALVQGEPLPGECVQVRRREGEGEGRREGTAGRKEGKGREKGEGREKGGRREG
jgi:hypothetical protein